MLINHLKAPGTSFLHPAPDKFYRGMSLIFILVFLVMIVFLMIPLISMFDFSGQTTVKGKLAILALTLATQIMEEIKGMDFDKVVDVPWTKPSSDWESGVPWDDSYGEFEYSIKTKTIAGTDSTETSELKMVVVYVRWNELGDRTTKYPREIKLGSLLVKENM